MSTVDEQLRSCATRGPSPFDPHWVDEARRLMLWAARTIEAAEPAMRAEYERGRSDFVRSQLDAVKARREGRDERLGLRDDSSDQEGVK